PLFQNLKRTLSARKVIRTSRPRLTSSTVFSLCIAGLLALVVYTSSGWAFQASLVPQVVGTAALLFVIMSLVYEVFLDPNKMGGNTQTQTDIQPDSASAAKMDAVSAMDLKIVLRRAGIFFASVLGFLLLTKIIGLLPGILVFVILWARLAGKESLFVSIATSGSLTVFSWFLFDRLLSIPWPRALLGDWIPVLREVFPYL
ncbi:MAG: tripartite tricarboxylate transporter TctB family protein, partial [Rhodospirillales bacterium]|nr:tripartite tricarboxylate transporter TctB family protein [Rhodospirillales bacterium]